MVSGDRAVVSDLLRLHFNGFGLVHHKQRHLFFPFLFLLFERGELLLHLTELFFPLFHFFLQLYILSLEKQNLLHVRILLAFRGIWDFNKVLQPHDLLRHRLLASS